MQTDHKHFASLQTAILSITGVLILMYSHKFEWNFTHVGFFDYLDNEYLRISAKCKDLQNLPLGKITVFVG